MSTVPTQHTPATASPPVGRRTPDASQLWPHDLLEAFCLRMSSQGMCVSRALMQHDRRYGLEQQAEIVRHAFLLRRILL